MRIDIDEYSGKDSITFGKIVTIDMPMETYPDKRTRTIRVWLPESYDGKRRFPVVYMHDGQNLFDGYDKSCGITLGSWHVDCEMETLEKDGMPAIVVGVDNAPTRFSELCPDIPINTDVYQILNLPDEEIVPTGNLYAEFIACQLKPFIDENFMTLPDKANTAIGGASMGGLMSLYMLLKYPDAYSKAMVFAPFFLANDEHELLSRLESYDFSKLRESRIFIFHGGLDIDALAWPRVQSVFRTMKDRGLDDTQLALLYDSRQPHYESAWQKYFAEAFRYLFLKDNDMVSADTQG